MVLKNPALDALPANARIAALQHEDVLAMAKAADAVVLENQAVAEAERNAVASINSLSLLDRDLDGLSPVPSPLVPLSPAPYPEVSAVSKRDSRPPFKKTDTLCAVHARWGKEAFKCLQPGTCKMKRFTKPGPAPAPSPPASGNGGAGGR